MRMGPSTASGAWSLFALLGFFAGIGLLFAAIAAGERGGETFTSNWLLAGPAILAAACGVAALVIGVVAIGRGDRAASIFVATFVGLLVALWVAAEIAFPH